MSIHGPSGRLGGDQARRSAKGVWRKISAVDLKLEKFNISLPSLFLRRVGNGRNTRFWDDLWCGNACLAEHFPRLAAVDANMSCLVADKLSRSMNGLAFTWEWRRNLREGREQKDMEMIREYCSNLEMHDGEERWVWGLDGSGKFTVASLRQVVDDKALRSCDPHSFWNRIVPCKVRILNWRIRIDRIASRDNLQKRGVVLVDYGCVFCKEVMETDDHLFMGCCIAKEVSRLLNV